MQKELTGIKTEPSLFAMFAKEVDCRQTIETDYGFITFRIFAEFKECMICDFFVHPDKRSTSLAYRLSEKAEKIAREKGCETMSCHITATREEQAKCTYKLNLYLKYGYEVVCLNGDQIVMGKRLGT